MVLLRNVLLRVLLVQPDLLRLDELRLVFGSCLEFSLQILLHPAGNVPIHLVIFGRNLFIGVRKNAPRERLLLQDFEKLLRRGFLVL